MIRGIHHSAISTPDLERSKTFYRDLLGFRVVGEYEWRRGTEVMNRLIHLADSSARYAMLRTGNALLEIFQFETPSPRSLDPHRAVSDHGLTHIALDVTDIDGEYRRLVACGMRFNCPPQDLEDGAMRCTYGYDPDGNVIELQEILDPDHSEALRWD